MKRMLETKRTAAAIAALLGSILPAQAGLLNIATDPLGTATTSNKPNVMFILDDSGSMGQDYTPDYVNDALPVGRELRLVDLAHRSEVLRFQETFFRSEGGRQRKCESEKSDDAGHGDGAFT